MNGFLLDTNVISEILRRAPDANVAAWSQQSDKQMLFLSVVSMGELRKGVTILPPSAQSSRNQSRRKCPSGSKAAFFQ